MLGSLTLYEANESKGGRNNASSSPMADEVCHPAWRPDAAGDGLQRRNYQQHEGRHHILVHRNNRSGAVRCRNKDDDLRQQRPRRCLRWGAVAAREGGVRRPEHRGSGLWSGCSATRALGGTPHDHPSHSTCQERGAQPLPSACQRHRLRWRRSTPGTRGAGRRGVQRHQAATTVPRDPRSARQCRVACVSFLDGSEDAVTPGLRGSLLGVGGVASAGPKEGPCAADPAPCLSAYCCRWW